jgi:phage protein U
MRKKETNGLLLNELDGESNAHQGRSLRLVDLKSKVFGLWLIDRLQGRSRHHAV